MHMAVISDIHYTPRISAVVGNRHCGWGDSLLLRAVHRLNDHVRPDVVVVLGDVLDDGTAPHAEDASHTLHGILSRLTMPWLIIPGNHDGPADAFHQRFPRPPAWVDIAGVRLVCFTDAEEPGYNARRNPDDVGRLASARDDGWKGPIVALQHVPLFTPGTHPCPYNYVNAPEILRAMRQSGIEFAVSGHFHAGIDCLQGDGVSTVVAPALCEAPFSFLQLEINGNGIHVERQDLALPQAAELVDSHCHTHLAYCNENMDIGVSRRMAAAFGLRNIYITEHSGHLYFPRGEYGPVCCDAGIASARPQHDRLEDYLQALQREHVPPACRGIEIDCDFHGNALVKNTALQDLPFRLGAMHYLPRVGDPDCTDHEAADIFLGLLTTFLSRHDVHALAHPFRVFRRSHRPIPKGLFGPVVKLLKRTHTAAEINVHTNNPPLAFLRLCLDAGVPFCLGSDAHNLYEVGEFYPHLQLLGKLGVTESRLSEVLLPL